MDTIPSLSDKILLIQTDNPDAGVFVLGRGRHYFRPEDKLTITNAMKELSDTSKWVLFGPNHHGVGVVPPAKDQDPGDYIQAAIHEFRSGSISKDDAIKRLRYILRTNIPWIDAQNASDALQTLINIKP